MDSCSSWGWESPFIFSVRQLACNPVTVTSRHGVIFQQTLIFINTSWEFDIIRAEFDLCQYLCDNPKSNIFPSFMRDKGKAIPLQAWTDPEGSRRSRLPVFKVIGTWRWYSQLYAPAIFTPQEIFLVLIPIRGWIDPRPRVRPEELCQWKIPITPSEIEPAILRP